MKLYVVLSILYVVTLTATIVTMYRDDSKGYFYTKGATSLLFLLIAAAYMGSHEGSLFKELAIGMFLCMCGDVTLSTAGETVGPKGTKHELDSTRFRLGLAFFLLAHVALFVAYERQMNWYIGPWLLMSVFSIVVIWFNVHSPKYDFGRQVGFAYCYAPFVGLFCGVGIQTLFCLGISRLSITMAAGAVVFLVSDALLTMKYFLKGVPRATGAFVLILYYGAMYILAICGS